MEEEDYIPTSEPAAEEYIPPVDEPSQEREAASQPREEEPYIPIVEDQSQAAPPSEAAPPPAAEAQPQQTQQEQAAPSELPEAEGKVGNLVREAAHAAVPGALGLAGTVAAGALAGSLLPGIGTLGGAGVALLAGLGVGTAASAAQEWLLKKFGFDDEAQRAANLKADPVTSGAGTALGMAPTMGVGLGINLVQRAANAGIGGAIDLYATGDPLHALGVAGASALLNKPTAAGQAIISGTERAVAPAANKISTLLAGKVQEAGVLNAETPSVVSDKTGPFPPGRPDEAPKVDGALRKEDVVTPGTDKPGPVAAPGTAESAIPPTKGGGIVSEPQNQPFRDQGNKGVYGKDQTGVTVGGEEPKPLGSISDDLQLALKGEPSPVGRAPEAPAREMAPVQQAQQEQPPGGPPDSPPPAWLKANQDEAIAKFKGTPVEKTIGDLARAGKTAAEIEAATGVDRATVRVLRDNMGIEPVGPKEGLLTQPGQNKPAAQPKAPADDKVPINDLIKELQAAEAKRTAAAENPPNAALDEATQRALAAGAKHEGLGRAAVQQSRPMEEAAAVRARSTLKKEAQERPAAPEPTTRYKEGEKSTPEKAAETVNRGFDNLTRNMNARWHEFQAKIRGDDTLHGQKGEDIYHAIERGELDKLDPKTKKAWEEFKAPYEARIKAGEQELVKRGIKPYEEANDPTHVHRIRNMPFSFKEWLNRDPTGMLRGMERPDPFKPLEYRGAQAPDGHRIVIQDMSPTKYAVWKNGEQHVYTAPQRQEGVPGFKTGDKIEYNGKQYTVDRGRTSEIEQHARDENGKPLQYKKNALLSLYEHDQAVQTALEHNDMIRTFKSDPALDPYRIRANDPEAKAKLKEGWKELDGKAFEDFKGLIMHPDMAQAIKNNFDPGLGMKGGGVNFLRALNQFAVRSIFWNPIPHTGNAGIHYVAARGEDWLPFTFQKDSLKIEKVGFDNYKRFFQSLAKGWDDVINQKGALIDLNRAGAPLVMSSIERGRAHELTGKMLGVSLKSEPHLWGGWAQKYGLGKAVDAVKAVYDGSARFLWSASDVMMAARIHENEMKGMSREQAMADASIHMPDYVLMNKLLGMRGLPSMMADSSVFMFGRYHSKVIDSLAHMTMDALGPKSTLEERRKAFGNIGALVMLGAVIYPAADAAIQKLTGNKDASMNRRGPLAPLSHAAEAYKGERTYSSEIANLLTLSPGAKYLNEQILQNRDFTGRNIVEPKSPGHKQAAQFAEYAAGTFVSPYKTASDALNPKGNKPSLPLSVAQQLADIKVPTHQQAASKQKGEEIRKQQAETREKRPRGLIEHGVSTLSKAVKNAFRSEEPPKPAPAPPPPPPPAPAPKREPYSSKPTSSQPARPPSTLTRPSRPQQDYIPMVPR